MQGLSFQILMKVLFLLPLIFLKPLIVYESLTPLEKTVELVWKIFSALVAQASKMICLNFIWALFLKLSDFSSLSFTSTWHYLCFSLTLHLMLKVLTPDYRSSAHCHLSMDFFQT